MSTIIVKADQDICDICIQEYGSLEFLDQIIKDNNFGYGDDVYQGQEIIINSEDVGNEDVKEYFELAVRNPKNGNKKTFSSESSDSRIYEDAYNENFYL